MGHQGARNVDATGLVIALPPASGERAAAYMGGNRHLLAVRQLDP